MGMVLVSGSRKAVTGVDGWMKNVDRVQGQLDRRRQISSASDLLGGGFGPTATLIQDWNVEDATFNGFFYSEASISLNSPDPTIGWAGIVIAEADRQFGIQEVWSSHDGVPPRRYVRRFSTAGGARSYTAWTGDTEWQTSGIEVAGTVSIVEQQWRVSNRTVFISVDMLLTAPFTTPVLGNISNTQLLQVPAEIAPSNAPFNQSLTSGYSGPLASWCITPTGAILLTASVPSVTLAAGSQLTCGGSYSL